MIYERHEKRVELERSGDIGGHQRICGLAIHVTHGPNHSTGHHREEIKCRWC